MSYMFFLQGVLLGFSIAAPVGPIGILCMQRTLARGFGMGVTAGAGAAFADATYGAVAGFGLTAVSAFLVAHESAVRFLGGVFLLYLAWKTMSRKHRDEADACPATGGYKTTFVSLYVLTLTNPMTVITFMALFAGLGLGTTDGTMTAAFALVVGCWVGSMIWSTFLTGTTAYFRSRLPERALGIVNAVSAVILAGFGAVGIIASFA